MDFINNFFKSGFVKIMILFIFLYFVYEKSKDDPRSFSNTLKNQDFKSNIANLKTNYEVIKKAKEEGVFDNQTEENPVDNFDNLEIEVIRQGVMDNEATCNDQVDIEYILMSELGNIANKSIIKIYIGENFNKIIEKTLIGMRPGEIRKVKIPKNFKTGDLKYDSFIESRDMIYQVMLIQINKSIANNYKCD
ncbi:MAG: hypothetical protein ACO201_03185 [Rickettsiales bacterium]